MWYTTLPKFEKTVSKDDIQNFVDHTKDKKWNVVQKIQTMKEDTVKRLLQWFSQQELKFINPGLVKWIEKEYFELLQQNDRDTSNGANINPSFDYTAEGIDTEKMFKKHEFTENYIQKFQNIYTQNILEIPKAKLIKRQRELKTNIHLWKNEKEELSTLNTILPLMDTKNIENTKSRNIMFDSHEFVQSTDKFNIECFFEQDKQGNKHYFSVNQLINDLETFGIESGYPALDETTLWVYTKELYTVQKFIKLALVKNILAKYRDYQEVVMYDFKDYEKYTTEKEYNNKSGILAEKVVEWSFRNFANLDDTYEVSIKKASVGQDQKNKIDLIIQIKDKKSGINIQKELQLTLAHDEYILQNKRIQIDRQKHIRHTDLDLLELELHLLEQKVTLWRNMDRPIWWLNNLLSLEDKEFLKETYKRIVQELQTKIQ